MGLKQVSERISKMLTTRLKDIISPYLFMLGVDPNVHVDKIGISNHDFLDVREIIAVQIFTLL